MYKFTSILLFSILFASISTTKAEVMPHKVQKSCIKMSGAEAIQVLEKQSEYIEQFMDAHDAPGVLVNLKPGISGLNSLHHGDGSAERISYKNAVVEQRIVNFSDLDSTNDFRIGNTGVSYRGPNFLYYDNGYFYLCKYIYPDSPTISL